MTLKQQVSDVKLGIKNLVILKKESKNYSVLHYVILHNFCDSAFLVKQM